MADIERCSNAIAAVLCECCTVEEIEDTLAQINPADWNRAAEKCLEAANYQGAVEENARLREALERVWPHEHSEAVRAYWQRWGVELF